jgi:ribosomal protein S18 acetylase RimI-like enzyme
MTTDLAAARDRTVAGARIEILPAGWRDLRGVYALEQACFGGDTWSVIELLLALISPNVRLKAMADERLVGFVIGEPHPYEGFAWIATIGVHPEFQRQGIGQHLLAEAEARLTTPVLKLTVRQSNHAAIALYQKFGYVPVSRWERYYSSGEAGIVMEKNRPRGSQ